jgi:GTP-binding protein EngB required for normal cell division
MGNQPRPFTMIPFGAPGVGKSNLLNKLLGRYAFESSSEVTSGVTKDISFGQGPAFGIEGNPLLRVYDLPGVGDIELPTAQIIYDIKRKIGTEQEIDAALVVVKLTDVRTSIQEMYAIKSIKTMIDNVEPKNTFMILTHCDLLKPSEKVISGKLASFNRYGPLKIQPENVVEFDDSTKSLEKFVEKL